MRTILENNRGITLIALIITIIVLLILSAISIVMLTGENGILKQTSKSKNETEVAEIKERVQTDISEIQIKNQTSDIKREEFKEILDKYFENVQEDYTLDTELIAKEEYGSHKIKVSDLYRGTLLTEKIITSKDITNAVDKGNYYGAIVKGYEVPKGTTTDVGWKIFYADTSNIYLIADNYVERTNLPNSTTETGNLTEYKPNDGSSGYLRTAYFTNVMGSYVGSARIKDSKLKLLNNDYFSKNYTSTNKNMKAVAYMMDTTAWNSKYKDVNNKAEYVIGGPTLEILLKSYSQKHKVDYQARAKDPVGYEISTDGGKTWKNETTVNSEYLDPRDSLYSISSVNDATGMWIASPSTNNNSIANQLTGLLNVR